MSTRQFLPPETKVAIVRAHLIDGVSISDLCDQHHIHPTQFYSWQKQLFDEGAVVFERKTNVANAKRQDNALNEKVAQLEARLQAKNEVVAELLEEHIKLKKANGGP